MNLISVDDFFKEYNSVVIEPGSFIDNLHFVRKFDRIICANSTFSWWAAFLSEASKIYTFARWTCKNNSRRLKVLCRPSYIKDAIRVDGEFYKEYKTKTFYAAFKEDEK